MSERAPVAISEVELEFGDGRYLFRLNLPQLAELQTKCGAGLGAIFKRVSAGDWQTSDLRETIRLALCGGGKGMVAGAQIDVSPVLASRLVETYVDARPWAEAWEHAVVILSASVLGYTPPASAAKAQKKSTSRRAATPKAGSITASL